MPISEQSVSWLAEYSWNDSPVNWSWPKPSFDLNIIYSYMAVLYVKGILPSLADMLLTCNVGSGLKLAYFNIDIVGVKAGRRPLGIDPPYI